MLTKHNDGAAIHDGWGADEKRDPTKAAGGVRGEMCVGQPTFTDTYICRPATVI